MPDESEPACELTYEQALGQLERMIQNLERGEDDLSSALGQYERSVKLLSLCQSLLDKAEQSVALLSGVNSQGNPITSPFDATATIVREADTITAEITSSPTAKPPQPGRSSARKVRAIPEVNAIDPLDPPF